MKKKEENNMGTTKTRGGIMKEKAVLVDIEGTLVEIAPPSPVPSLSIAAGVAAMSSPIKVVVPGRARC